MNVEVLPDDQPNNSFDDAMVIWLDVQLFLLRQDSFSVSASVDALILDKTIQHFEWTFGYCIKTGSRLLKLVYHPADQETLTKEDLMVIAICSMLDVWQQQFEL